MKSPECIHVETSKRPINKTIWVNEAFILSLRLQRLKLIRSQINSRCSHQNWAFLMGSGYACSKVEAVASLWLILCIDWVWVQQKSSEDVVPADLKKYFPNWVNRSASRNSKSLQRKLAHLSGNNCTPRPSGGTLWDKSGTWAASVLASRMPGLTLLPQRISYASTRLSLYCSLSLHEPFHTV